VDSVLSDILATCLPGVALVALSLAAAEIGYRIGRRLKAGADDAMRSEVYTLQTATLALLALLLGFSFAMGASAYENRRRVILDETLVIAKAHKHPDRLPERIRSEVRERLIHYIDTRLDLFYQGASGEHRVRAKLHESQRLQHEIWERAVAVTKQEPQSIPVGRAIEALSAMGDLNTRRVAALGQVIPPAMKIALALVVTVAMGWVSCGIGLGPRRNVAMPVILSLLFGFLIAIVIDLDQPRHGIMRASQRALTTLQETLRPVP
jgi:hypothetical protein